jgi:predicted RNA binding protein YcfA (HicA-like mRNA interferase family)
MPSDVAFRDLRRLLEKHGWTLTRISGSHHVFTGPGGPIVTIPVHRGKVRHVYLRKVENAVRELGERGGSPDG